VIPQRRLLRQQVARTSNSVEFCFAGHFR
jgi:hypothetical protein